MKIKWTFFFAVLLCVFGLACSNGSEERKNSDNPVSGEILIVCDESYQPLIRVQLETFQAQYQYAKINVRYLPEAEVFEQFKTNDSVRLAITARSLDEAEQAHFVEMKIIPRETRIAVDAVAFVVNKENPDSLMSFERLRDVLQGKTKNWKEINSNTKLDNIQIVFDRNGSSNARYLKENFLGNEKAPSNWFSINSSSDVIDYVSSSAVIDYVSSGAVIDYVSNSKSAIGVIAVNWISDKDSPEVNEFLNKVNVLQVSSPDTGQVQKEYFKPYQAYIALKKYPFTRDVLIVSREGRNGLGTGFASFVAGDQGQRLVRLMGMLPATMPIRIVKIN